MSDAFKSSFLGPEGLELTRQKQLKQKQDADAAKAARAKKEEKNRIAKERQAMANQELEKLLGGASQSSSEEIPYLPRGFGSGSVASLRPKNEAPKDQRLSRGTGFGSMPGAAQAPSAQPPRLKR